MTTVSIPLVATTVNAEKDIHSSMEHCAPVMIIIIVFVVVH